MVTEGVATSIKTTAIRLRAIKEPVAVTSAVATTTSQPISNKAAMLRDVVATMTRTMAAKDAEATIRAVMHRRVAKGADAIAMTPRLEETRPSLDLVRVLILVCALQKPALMGLPSD